MAGVGGDLSSLSWVLGMRGCMCVVDARADVLRLFACVVCAAPMLFLPGSSVVDLVCVASRCAWRGVVEVQDVVAGMSSWWYTDGLDRYSRWDSRRTCV